MTSTLFCLDFDETLMNTDLLRTDLLSSIQNIGNEELAQLYLEAYEATRAEHGVPRIPLVLKTMAERYGLSHSTHQQLADLFHTFPYQSYLYDGVEQAIRHLKQFGTVIVLSDGDGFFQTQKIYHTPVAELVDGVIVLTSKITHFDDIAGYYPMERYIFIDDKQKVLNAAKNYFGEKAHTIFVRQGRYANEAPGASIDTTIAHIADLTEISF